MYSSDHIEGLMRSLTPTQLERIREEYLSNSPHDWVIFHVNIFNAGAVVSATFRNSPEEPDREPSNWSDINIRLEDVITLLEKYEL